MRLKMQSTFHEYSSFILIGDFCMEIGKIFAKILFIFLSK